MDELETYTLPRSPGLPLESLFMRLPSGSLLLLVSLVVSSSFSAFAAPVGDGAEDSSAYVPLAVRLAQPNNYLQTRDFVDKVTALLAVPPELGKAIPDILHAISQAAEQQGAPVVGPNPPCQPSLPRGHARRQVAAGAGNGPGPPEYRPLAPDPP